MKYLQLLLAASLGLGIESVSALHAQDRAEARRTVASATAGDGTCPFGMNATDMPLSYNDRSVGFFVDMGMVFTDWYGLTDNFTDNKLKSYVNTFTKPAEQYAKAQSTVSDQDLYASVTGLLQILIQHTVNDTSLSYEDYKNYGINSSVFSFFAVKSLVHHRGKALKLAQEYEGGNDVAVKKDVAIRRMQLKFFEAKGPNNMTTIISDSVDWSDYKTRYVQYVQNICMATKDIETDRQVRNHFAYWLASGTENTQSEEALTATYSSTGDPNAFYLQDGVKFGLLSGLITLAGAALIGVFLAV
jgi:hypothetical protein